VGARGAVLEVDGMVAVQVRPILDTTHITAPHYTNVVIHRESECIGVLAETIDVRVLWEVGSESEVLRLRYQRVLAGGEQHLLGASGADDLEGKGRGGVRIRDGRFGG
jgi:hypothetical protein